MSKTSNPQKRRRSSQNRPVFFPNLAAGGTGIDLVAVVTPVTSISGTRYGIVNNTVTQFEVNQPPLEDDGLRGCPAFTSYWSPSDIGNGVSHSIDDGWNKLTLLSNTGQYTFCRALGDSTVTGDVSIMQAIIKKGTTRFCGFRARVGGLPDPVHDVFDFDIGDFITNLYHEKIFVKQLSSDTYHVCVRNISPSSGGAYFSIVLCDSVGNETSNASMQVGSYFYFKALTATQGVNLTSLGQPNPVETISYVSEVATATTGSSFDLDDALLARLKTALRGPNAQGHLELTFKSNVDSGWLANNFALNIMTQANASFGPVYIYKDTSGVCKIQAYDNTTVIALNNTLSIGQTFKISLDWGTHSTGPKMRLTVNGVRSTLANFSGSFGTQDLRFFYGNTVHSGWIVKDSLKAMDRPQW